MKAILINYMKIHVERGGGIVGEVQVPKILGKKAGCKRTSHCFCLFPAADAAPKALSCGSETEEESRGTGCSGIHEGRGGGAP